MSTPTEQLQKDISALFSREHDLMIKAEVTEKSPEGAQPFECNISNILRNLCLVAQEFYKLKATIEGQESEHVGKKPRGDEEMASSS